MSELINQKEAAEMFNRDPRYIAKLALEHELQFVKRGREKLYRKEDLTVILEENKLVTERKVFMIGSPKGGTGKTTSTKYAARILANQGSKVLVVDCDPQHYYTDFAIATWDIEDKKKLQDANLFALLTGKKKLTACAIQADKNIDFIAGLRRLEYYERELTDMPLKELRIKKALAPALSRYDYILLDSSPSQSGITKATLYAAHVLIIPIIPDIDSMEAARDLVRTIDKMKSDDIGNNFKLSEIVILPVRQKGGLGASLSKQILNDIKEEFTGPTESVDIDVTVLPPVMDYPRIVPVESYEGVLTENNRPYKDYYNSLKEVFNY